MKNFDSRTNSIQDFVEYDKQKALVLNQHFNAEQYGMRKPRAI